MPTNRDPEGFTRDFSGREAPCIAPFGGEGTGKTRLCATASQWAQEHGKTPAWLVFDRKTRRTVREVHAELGLPLPYISTDFITVKEALDISEMDREKDDEKIARIYTDVVSRIKQRIRSIADEPKIEPVIVETGTQLWDYISYSHFGRKQGVGKSRVWGPPKQDWTDMFDAISHKATVISFWERDAYVGDERANYTKPDGPPHLGYIVTSQIRLRQDRKKKLDEDAGETYVDRFALDVYVSQDNVGLEGVSGVLTGADINYTNLLRLLRPEGD